MSPQPMSRESVLKKPRIRDADKVVASVCPYCAVGCSQLVYVKNKRIIDIEGNPASPINEGTLCPKGAATYQYVVNPNRVTTVRYRAAHSDHWEDRPLEWAMDRIATLIKKTRDATFVERTAEDKLVNQTTAIATLGGATMDIEENYLIKKLFTGGVGVVSIETQGQKEQSSAVPGLGTSFGRGGATTFQQDLANADAILIMGSNMAENHPVGFRWPMKAREKGATIIHVDPRFTRTSAAANLYVPIRSGSDIAFLGGLINHVLTNDKWFKEYVLAYSNASTIVSGDYVDAEDNGGLFSGYDPQSGTYDNASWTYAGSGPAQNRPERDETLQDPRCVFQILKRHYARYTPEMVERVCGTPKDLFLQVADVLTKNSGRERTSAICYAVGWTQQSSRAHIVRAAGVAHTPV